MLRSGVRLTEGWNEPAQEVRPGMISAATALLMITLVKEHGPQYLSLATLLTGVLKILAGCLKPEEALTICFSVMMLGSQGQAAWACVIRRPIQRTVTKAR